MTSLEEMDSQSNECDKLLRAVKKEVKQIMEEAVTKKFVHEDSGSIISLCVAVDACLSHGLKRRVLGLFKTNSTTALVQKIAKNCDSAAEVIKSLDQACKGNQLRTNSPPCGENSSSNSRHSQVSSNSNSVGSAASQQQQAAASQQGGSKLTTSSVSSLSPIRRANNKRYLWIKTALLMRKLISIMDHLTKHANKYYEDDALMSDYFYAQLLSSLLVGPCALDFSRMKTHDHLWTDPSADELVQRHNLANPIECGCKCNHFQNHNTQNATHSNSPQGSRASQSGGPATSNSSHSATSGQNNLNLVDELSSATIDIMMMNSNEHHYGRHINNHHQQPNNCASPVTVSSSHDLGSTTTTPTTTTATASTQSRKPLALSQSLKTTMVTDCHHFDCKHSNHRHNSKGYSFTSQDQAPIWSPRMLHETLHQNSKLLLLYAKNNVLMQTSDMQTMPGYLSLHQSSGDLIIKWIPNQMINGGNGTNISICNSNTNSNSLQSGNKQQPQAAEMPDGAGTGAGEQSSAADNSCRPVEESPPVADTCGHEPTLAPASAGSAGSAAGQLPQSQSVKSSYLDLVVSLSVSRIVYLHCHEREDTGEGTIILVERDGTQRAPFIFPKGGLWSFLSCIESGLEPHSSLDPPLSMRYSSGHYSTGLLAPLSPNDCDSPAHQQRQMQQQDSLGDLLMSKLTLLGRRKQKQQTQSTPTPTTSTSSCELTDPARPASEGGAAGQQFSNRTAEQQEGSGSAEGPARLAPSDYVFRIVAPLDKMLLPSATNSSSVDTPPNSANSTNDDLSLATQSNGHSNAPKYRWNLSKFTQFATIAKYSTSSTNSTGSSSLKSASIGTATGESLDSCWSPSSTTPATTVCNNSNISSTNSTNPTITVDTLTTTTQSHDIVNSHSADLRTTSNDVSKISNQNGEQLSNGKICAAAADSHCQSAAGECRCPGTPTSHHQADQQTLIQTNQSIQTLCHAMRKQIISRAFYGWLTHCRHFRTVRLHLAKLVKKEIVSQDYPSDASVGLNQEIWLKLHTQQTQDVAVGGASELAREMFRLVYFGGIKEASLRKTVWPYLLGHYQFEDSEEARTFKDNQVRELYYSSMNDWQQIEAVVRQRDRDICAANMAKYSNERKLSKQNKDSSDSILVNKREVTFEDSSSSALHMSHRDEEVFREETMSCANDDDFMTQPDDNNKNIDNNNNNEQQTQMDEDDCTVAPANGQDDVYDNNDEAEESQDVVIDDNPIDKIEAIERRKLQGRLESTGSVGSDASITDQFGCNIHRIDKDVQRCDRNYWYFTNTTNLDKLRNVMCSYVWQNLDVGYVQGMCDLAAPFLVIFDDEIMAYSCFSLLMKRMVANFPHGGAMDQHFASLRYMLQVLDPELFEMMQSNGDYTHFYFCYRWLLLDFKRELTYEDVFRVWEIIWAASHISTDNFVLFVALAMIKYYRDIIIENNMDFTDTIKFFNEMAEKHDAQRIVSLAKDCVLEVQNMLNA